MGTLVSPKDSNNIINYNFIHIIATHTFDHSQMKAKQNSWRHLQENRIITDAIKN